jgi:purine-binding chemotaxis protein CheW
MTKESINQADGTMLVATFFLGDAAFGIDTAQVQEVVRVGPVTPVHHAPAWVVGVMNLRGRIVTIIDLRVKLALARVSPGPESRIFIVEWQGEQVGLLVDRVADAIEVGASDVRPAPGNVHGAQGMQVRGVCPAGGGRLAALLDLDAVLGLEEDKAASAAGKTQAT